MNRKTIVLFLVALLLCISACAVRRPEPRQEPPVRETPRQTPQPVEDNLAKSDQEGLEENINAADIERDKELTRRAQQKKDTGELLGLTPEELKLVRQKTGESPINDVLEEYRSALPEDLNKALQYQEYLLTYDYFLITAEEDSVIRRSPAPNAPEVCTAIEGEKLTLLARVRGEPVGDSDIWFQVACKKGGQVQTGYVHAAAGTPRQFRFDRMLSALRDLEQHSAQGPLHHISNYKNVNGAPPVKNGSAVDEFGLRIYQSAPGYAEPNTEADFRYIPDGILLRILDETGDFYRVNVLTYEGEYHVPKRYIHPDLALRNLTHVIVVDRDQQNQGTFSLEGGSPTLVSYTLATTGFTGKSSFETPLGYFKTIEKRERFDYLRSGTREIAGYAPFAVRFCGGAYVHGVPVEYDIVEGERVDPGMIEYLHTLGTTPRSSMCVRNFTSHARFLYEWMDTPSGAVIVIE